MKLEVVFKPLSGKVLVCVSGLGFCILGGLEVSELSRVSTIFKRFLGLRLYDLRARGSELQGLGIKVLGFEGSRVYEYMGLGSSGSSNPSV